MSYTPAHIKKHKLAIIYLLISAVIWGAGGPIIKFTLNYIPPFTFLFLRFLVSTVFFLPFFILEERRHPVAKKDWVNLIVVCLLGGTIYLSFVFFGFLYSTSLDATLISSVAPIFILVASEKLLKEKVTRNERNGSYIALFGTLLVTIVPFLKGGSFKLGLTQFVGNLFIILSMVVWTMHTIWSKKILNHIPSKLGTILHYFHLRTETRRYSPMFLIALLSVVSLITFAPLSFLELAQINGLRMPTEGFFQYLSANAIDYKIPALTSEFLYPLLGVFYMGVFSSVIAYGMYEWVLKEVPVVESSIYGYLPTVFAIPFAYLLLGETVSFWFVVGSIVIGYGVVLSEKK